LGQVLLTTLGVWVFLVIGAVVVGIVYVARNKDAWKAQGREVQAREMQCRHYGLGDDLNCKLSLFMSVPIFCGEQQRKGNSQ
jgi:hypothetical protein